MDIRVQTPTGFIGGVNRSVREFTAPRVTTNTLLQFQQNVTDNWGQTGTSFVNVLDKPAMAIHALSLSSSLPHVKSQATVTKAVRIIKIKPRIIWSIFLQTITHKNYHRHRNGNNYNNSPL